MRFAASTLLCLIAAPLAIAGDAAPSDTIVVTATRTDKPLSDTIVPVTIIDRDAIELSGATDLAELLRFEAGIDIGRNGGPGQATSLFFRGTDSNHTLILIDGVRMNPGTIGGGAVQHISPEFIERVEIVKGARSALFGTEAIGGVINIITRRVSDSRLEAGMGSGSFNTRSGYFSGGLQRDSLELGITVDATETDGFSPRTSSELERGYDNATIALFATRKFGQNSVSIRHWNASGNVEYLDFIFSPDDQEFRLTPVDQDFRNTTSALEWTSNVAESLKSRLIVSHSQDDIEQNQSPDFVRSDRLSVDWQLDKDLGNHLVTMGLFSMQESAESLSFGSGFDEGTDVRAVFLQDQWATGKHRTFIAARLTDHETFGNEVTWNFDYGYDLTDELRVSIGAARAFRAPDASDRFGFGGDPELAPEIADEVQFGLRYAPADRHVFRLDAYANDIEDLIEFELTTFTLQNISQAKIRGAELSYEYVGDTFSLNASMINQRAEDRETGARLLRRAEQSLSVGYTQRIGNHRLGLSMLASGDREDFGGTKLAGYLLANLTGQFALNERMQLNARIENLLDRDYATAAGFRSQERSAFVELRYSWN